MIIAHANKGLGPVGVETLKYIRWALKDHLLDERTYTIVPEEQALEDAGKLYNNIQAWVSNYWTELLDDAQKFIHHKLSETINDPFCYFYLTIKLHKTPISTHPVCSDCASLPHTLRQWVDEQLQSIVKGQLTYFKNFFDLKKEFDGITLPANASIFTYDALSTYTNIDREECIACIEQYLWLPATHFRFYHKHPAQSALPWPS